MNQKQLYNNRELSWLAFNQRVLEEAIDPRNLLLERLKFLSIFSANLDEFFMVRVAGLTDQVKAKYEKPDNKSGLTPKEQLDCISKKTHQLVEKQYETYQETLLPLLREEGILLQQVEELNPKQISMLETYFDEKIYPVLTPMAIDAYRPFPKLLSKSLNLAIVLTDKANQRKMAFVQVPAVLGRYVKIEQGTTFVLLENLIAFFINKLFKGYLIKSVLPFRITRNADLTIHEDGVSDLLIEIEKELKKRKWGAEIRLEVAGPVEDDQALEYIQERLELQNDDTYIVQGPLDLTFLFSFYKEIQTLKPNLINKPFIPQLPPQISYGENLFQKALDQDILLHHPYNSFEPVVELIAKAAEDPNVLTIKQTLYRVSGDSSIIKALKRAVINGKQVTVLVELKARFDEENNVSWAKELEKEGCHVIYGFTHLKTHSKITLIVRKRNNKIERFVHLGTGNYNDATAKLYTDIGIITTNPKIGVDATNFFNYISGYNAEPNYNYLVVAPHGIREEFITLINREILCHQQYGNGHIIAKMNSLSDKILIDKLYEASKNGVKIDLIVRGICCLRPGIKGVSETITVRSILGRFLEHSRIYYFYQNGEEGTYLSSADLMTRNMDMRIEILFPVLEISLKTTVKKWLLLYLSDNIKAREQNAEGSYHYVKKDSKVPPIHSQEILGESNTFMENKWLYKYKLIIKKAKRFKIKKVIPFLSQ
ncbi:RNA degradosome polyphosphate kinase [Bacillus solitudinis]|uniref:RNA degradosome polyphosphate kinase n=1 Tax=Bacillus solitudinis TaxID=2014074 RepID=UPI000C23EA7E|nr:RNA degradosome polyphosphate kinase [Bacillus solitudinis]